MVKSPPYLRPGDIIGIVCPSGYMSFEKTQSCLSTLEDWGYRLRIGKTVESNSQNYFSGNDDERRLDLQQMLDDDEVNAVFCARGGYGIGRIIEQVDFKKFRKNPKWIIGFSDVTILHSNIYDNYKIASIHAPMASTFNNDGYKNEFVQSLKQTLEGKKIRYQCATHEFNKKGEAVGELVGGNLSLLAHLIGSSSDVKTKGRILFLEDTGEYLYNIDRLFYQLKRNGKLNGLAGLIIGGFTDLKDTARPFGKNVDEIIHEAVKEFDYPVCFHFPVGHQRENYALKAGIGYKLKVGKGKTTLEE
jgi:muramoyltetrapeptide carboxypeptidase